MTFPKLCVYVECHRATWRHKFHLETSVSCVLALVYPIWLTIGTLPLLWASSVHSADGDICSSDSDLLVKKFSFGSVCSCAGFVRSVSSSRCLHEEGWTRGQLFSTKGKQSIFLLFKLPALPHTWIWTVCCSGRLCSSTFSYNDSRTSRRSYVKYV